MTGIDLSEQEALDPEVVPSPTPGDNDDDHEANNSSITVASQSFKAFVSPTSFYAKPPEKEKRKPLWVSFTFVTRLLTSGVIGMIQTLRTQ